MTHFIRKYLMNAYTALPLLFCLMLIHWPSQGASLPTNAKHQFSGEEMFRGLFFLEGQYAQVIPELQSLNTSYSRTVVKPVEKRMINQIHNRLIETIRSQRPHYFDNLRQTLEMGDPMEVQAALKVGRSVVAEAVERLYALDQNQLNQLHQQASNLSVGGKATRETIEQMAKTLRKGRFESRRDAGTCVVVIGACTIILMCQVAICLVVSTEELAQTSSSLLTEQMVASICRLSAQNPS